MDLEPLLGKGVDLGDVRLVGSQQLLGIRRQLGASSMASTNGG